MDYNIAKVNVDEKSLIEITSLLNLCFPKSVDIETLEYLTWEYSENPDGKVVGFNAYSEETLVAHYATIPISMLIEGKRRRGLLSLNTATHPDHRGKGLFVKLAQKTYDYAKDNGYDFVIGVANANSTHGFIKYLGFDLICPLTFKVGFGLNINNKREFTYRRYWDSDLLGWRMKCPSYKYYRGGNSIVSPILYGAKKIVKLDTDYQLKHLWFRPLNLYVGLGAALSKGLYFKLPKFIKHSPFNLIFKDLTGGLPKLTPENIWFELIDFDVA
jgi:GNAT superfamily N-acetyltransferase